MTQSYLKNILCSCILLAGLSAGAQVNEVLKASQFGGISNVGYNPAIADNRFLVDINLISASTSIENNYLGIKSSALLHPSYFNDPNFQADYVKERLNGAPKNLNMITQVQGPLSFLVSFGKHHNNKNAIALSWHTNSILNINGVSQELARIFYYGIGTKANAITGFDGTQLSNGKFRVNQLSWTDFGVTYSRVVLDAPHHMIKVGATPKFLVGETGAYASSDGVNYKITNYDTLSIHGNFQYGRSANLTNIYNGQTGSNAFTLDNFKNGLTKVSFGMDLGVIYEWRPDEDKGKYQMDCQDYYRHDINRYKISVGASIVDIGRLRFNKPEDVENFSANYDNWAVTHSGIYDLPSFDSVVANTGSKFTRTDLKQDFKIWLPTRLNLFIDYEIYKGLGLNLNGTISPNFAGIGNQVRYPSSISLTPRYDYKWVGVYIPLTYNDYGNFGAGFGLRAGPVFVSSSNLFTVIGGTYTFNANIQAGVKISIPQRKIRDHDKDGVSNKYDKCPKQKGTCATHGCPDRDGDGVTDDIDKCPDIPGPARTQGCPDRDSDGVYDMNDSCPDTPGPAALNGCPDTDGDGIIDKYDDCPTIPGPARTHGCPDRDSDGVADKDDLCPDVPGSIDHHGCPDTDGDGLYDYEDSCPLIKGPIENHGCPWPDTDGDGILDKDDACPTVYGVPENHGCPALTKKELQTIKYAFDNLEFETGKDKIKQRSYISLDGLAALLKEKGYGLRIDGHTDNVGAYEMNMELSRKRAEAVKAYLMGRGVNGSKLETNGYGYTKPIADNSTAAGRQKNRRVEMNIIYK
jgi:outer membrane protein OmpA-like peptidoglycan-associated protein